MVSQQFQADLSQLSVIRRYVFQQISDCEMSDDNAEDIVFAANEIATNIIVHGYQKQGGIIEIEVDLQPDCVVVYLRDDAPVFKPTDVETPNLSLPLEQRPLGKLGIYMTREYMDEVTYQARGDIGNEVTLVKHI